MSGDTLFTQQWNGYTRSYVVPNEVVPERAVARATDPSTSREAAASVKGLRRTQLEVLEVLVHYGPSTDEQIAEQYAHLHPRSSWTPSGLRSRRAELVRKGLVGECGYGVTASGRRCQKWTAL